MKQGYNLKYTFLIMTSATALEVARYLEFRPFFTEPELPRYLTHTIVKIPALGLPGFIYECQPRSEAMISAARIVLQSDHAKLVR